MAECSFCHPPAKIYLGQNDLFVAFPDKFPVSPGHSLLVPRRHVASFFELVPQERRAMEDLLFQVKGLLDHRHHPKGYNIGWNDGSLAGQTVMHFHLHIIPRYEKDVDDPRGGIRWIFPDKAVYWAED